MQSESEKGKVTTLEAYLHEIKNHMETYWTKEALLSLRNRKGESYKNRSGIMKRFRSAWFRGQSHEWDLQPRLYRDGGQFDELNMMLDCRRKLSILPEAPEWGDLPSWLFLIQHHLYLDTESIRLMQCVHHKFVILEPWEEASLLKTMTGKRSA